MNTTSQSASHSLDLGSITRLRAEAFATVRHNTAMILSLTSAIEALDAAMLVATERNVDELQSLVTATCRLAELLDGSAVQQ